jgi:hypothetical protein
METPVTGVVSFCFRNKSLVVACVVGLCLWGVWAMLHLPPDAQVIVLSRWDRSPDLIEDQVTYPICRSHSRRTCGSSHVRDDGDAGSPRPRRGAPVLRYFPACATRVPSPNRNFPCITDECPGAVQKNT